jgi:hypothetical protein
MRGRTKNEPRTNKPTTKVPPMKSGGMVKKGKGC